jgi:hypothetical protein
MAGSGLECVIGDTLVQGLLSLNLSEFFMFGGAMVSMVTLSYVILNPATKNKQNVINEASRNLTVEKKQVYLSKVLKLIRKFYDKIIN